MRVVHNVSTVNKLNLLGLLKQLSWSLSNVRNLEQRHSELDVFDWGACLCLFSKSISLPLVAHKRRWRTLFFKFISQLYLFEFSIKRFIVQSIWQFSLFFANIRFVQSRLVDKRFILSLGGFESRMTDSLLTDHLIRLEFNFERVFLDYPVIFLLFLFRSLTGDLKWLCCCPFVNNIAC